MSSPQEEPTHIYAIFLGVSPPWVTLELLFSKKYRTLGIMKHEMRNEMK